MYHEYSSSEKQDKIVTSNGMKRNIRIIHSPFNGPTRMQYCNTSLIILYWIMCLEPPQTFVSKSPSEFTLIPVRPALLYSN